MKTSATLSATLVAAISFFALTPAAQAQAIKDFDDPSAKASTTGSETRLVLEAGDADAKATARVAKTFLRINKKPDDPDSYTRFAFTLSAPFDSKKADKADVGSLSGLTAGTTATLDFALVIWPRSGKSMESKCQDYVTQFVPGHDWKTTIGKSGLVGCDRHLFERENIDKAIDGFNEKLAACKKCPRWSPPDASRCSSLANAESRACATDELRVTAACVLLASTRKEACTDCDNAEKECELLAGKTEAKLDEDEFNKVVADHKREIRRLDREAYPGEKWLNVSLKANQQNFTYVLQSAPTAALDSQEEGFGASLGYTYLRDVRLWSAGYSHEESYKGGRKTQICSPIGTTGSTSCSEAIIGAPTKEKAELAFIEHRRLIAGRKFALAPRVEFDFKTSKWAAQVPFYFIPSKDGTQLTGGIAIGYSEGDDDEFGATIFISKAFSFTD